MTNFLRLRAWMAGSLLAALLALASWFQLPGLREVEARSLDLIFRYGRPNPPEPTRAIVHIDVDDQSIDIVGRWPWPRATLAQAIRTIDEAGARVIAIDILLTEPEPPRYPIEGVIDDDKLLEEAFERAQAKIILAVDPTTTAVQLEGAERWDDIVAALRSNIRLSAEELIQGLELPPDRAVRARDHLNKYKRIAIRKAVEELRAEGSVSLDLLRARLLTNVDRKLEDFPELPLLRTEVARSDACVLLERDLMPAPLDSAYEHADSLNPPIERFARHAAPGVVKAEPDPDGVLRRVTYRWSIHGHVYPQLGVAAAAAFLGMPPDALAADRMTFPGNKGPFEVEGQHLLLSWPHIDPLRPTYFAAHIPLGRVVELARGEQLLATLETVQLERTRELVRRYLASEYSPEDLDDPLKAKAIDEELLGEAELQLEPAGGEDVEGPGEEGTEDEEELRILKLWRNWIKDREKILAARIVLPPARRSLAEAIDGKLVFIGWSASGNFGDFYPTAVAKRTPGVLAHGIVANSLITSYVIREAPAWIGALATLALGILAAVITRGAGPRFSFLLVLLLAVLFLTIDLLIVFDGHATTMATAAPVLSMFSAWAGTTVVRAIQERREKAQLQRQFGARVSPKLFEFLINHPDMVQLEGEEREVTCFFSDLEGFTALSERLDSKGTVALLNAYMFAMNEVLTKHAAYVNKFLGDGIMCVWGAFERDTPHADSACRAALECQQRLVEMNRTNRTAGHPDLGMRIGIATGTVTLGDCGAPPDLRDYTVIGDAANLAARLESANKQFGTHILINGITKAQLSDDVLTRPLGHVTVVGQKVPAEIHEVLALAPDATDEQRLRIERTVAAVESFRARQWDDAATRWTDLSADPDTAVVASLYLQAIESCRAQPESEFDGVLHLTRK